MTAWGPYQTDAEVRADCVGLDHADDLLARLEDVCRESGVEVGARDRQTLLWAARIWEAESVQVVVGLISRAHAAGAKSRGGDQRD